MLRNCSSIVFTLRADIIYRAERVCQITRCFVSPLFLSSIFSDDMHARARARECPVFARIAVSPSAELNKLNHLVSSFTICSESGRASVMRAYARVCIAILVVVIILNI